MEIQIDIKKATGRRGQSADFTNKYSLQECELERTLKLNI